MQPSGTETVIYSFLGTIDSAIPYGTLVQAIDGSFYGTNSLGFTGTQNYVPGLFLQHRTEACAQGADSDHVHAHLGGGQPADGAAMGGIERVLVDGAVPRVGAGRAGGIGMWNEPQAGATTSAGFGGTAMITPTLEGTYTYVLNCGGTERGMGTLVVGNLLTVQTKSLPSAKVANAYSQALTATGGTPPYTWLQIADVVPSGLTFNPSTGLFSDTPDQFGDASIEVQVNDSASTPNTANGVVTLSVKSGPVINTQTLPKATVGMN